MKKRNEKLKKEIQYIQIITLLENFGFEKIEDLMSDTVIGPDEEVEKPINLKDLVSKYRRDQTTIEISRIVIVDDETNTEELIMLFAQVNICEKETIELLNIHDFFEYFKDDIRKIKISKIIN